MARTHGSKNKNTLEFIQLYETLKDQYGCPVETLFSIMKNKRADKSHRIAAARTLLPYRYSQREREKPDEGIQGELYLAWDNDDNDSATA